MVGHSSPKGIMWVRFLLPPPMIQILFILVGNSLPLIGKLAWDWSTFYLLFLYWLDTVVIFIFTYLKMRKAQGPSDARFNAPREQKLSTFLFIGIIFLVVLGFHIALSTLTVSSTMALPPVNFVAYGIPLLLLIGSSVIGYRHYVKSGAYTTISLEDAQGWVFARILLIFFVLLVSTFIFGPFHQLSALPIAIFVILKNAGDIAVYKQHE